MTQLKHDYTQVTTTVPGVSIFCCPCFGFDGDIKTNNLLWLT